MSSLINFVFSFLHHLYSLIAEILSKAPPECLKVSFDRNGTWHPVIENKAKETSPTLIDVNRIDIITLDDSDEENLKGGNNDNHPTGVSAGEARMDLETEHEEEEDEESEQDDDEDTEQDDESDDASDDDDSDDDSNEDSDEEGKKIIFHFNCNPFYLTINSI